MKNKSIIAIIAAAFTGGLAFAADSGVPKEFPLQKCPISGKAYGSGGMKAFKVTHDGTDVWLCCKSCKGDFDKDPAKYAKQVKDAAPKK
jgi:YHS domain-containing protein